MDLALIENEVCFLYFTHFIEEKFLVLRDTNIEFDSLLLFSGFCLISLMVCKFLKLSLFLYPDTWTLLPSELLSENLSYFYLPLLTYVSFTTSDVIYKLCFCGLFTF